MSEGHQLEPTPPTIGTNRPQCAQNTDLLPWDVAFTELSEADLVLVNHLGAGHRIKYHTRSKWGCPTRSCSDPVHVVQRSSSHVNAASFTTIGAARNTSTFCFLTLSLMQSRLLCTATIGFYQISSCIYREAVAGAMASYLRVESKVKLPGVRRSASTRRLVVSL